MKYVVVDVESDGPVPPLYSMVCFGAVVVEPELNRSFYGETRPISEKWNPDALSISGISREQHLKFELPDVTMQAFDQWVRSLNEDVVFVSDNLAYDWCFINYYLHAFTAGNVFGWSGRRIGDLWCGYVNNPRARWKHMRQTRHTHNPVDDARGNAEAMLEMRRRGLKI